MRRYVQVQLDGQDEPSWQIMRDGKLEVYVEVDVSGFEFDSLKPSEQLSVVRTLVKSVEPKLTKVELTRAQRGAAQLVGMRALTRTERRTLNAEAAELNPITKRMNRAFELQEELV